MTITDHELHYLSGEFVGNDIHHKYGISFEYYVHLRQTRKWDEYLEQFHKIPTA